MSASFFLTALATTLALMSFGGGFYEISVVDPVWPKRLDLIQPRQGGLSRRRFWIPAHATFELALIAALALSWQQGDLRFWLLVAFASHAVMRIWSAFDFIPKALAFERGDAAGLTEGAARSWARRSRLRLPLDLVTCFAMLAGFATAARIV